MNNYSLMHNKNHTILRIHICITYFNFKTNRKKWNEFIF